MKKKRDIDKLAAKFEERMEWLEAAWSCRTEYEVDLGSGAAWVKITMPENTTALVIRCDVAGITLPGHDPDRGNQ